MQILLKLPAVVMGVGIENVQGFLRRRCIHFFHLTLPFRKCSSRSLLHVCRPAAHSLQPAHSVFSEP